MKPLFISMLSLLFCFAAWAAPADLEKISAAFRESFPKLAVDEIKGTAVQGLYEIISGDRIFYYAPDSGHLLVGNLISKEGENVTFQRMQEVMALRIRGISLEEALKIGAGPNQVIEVTDPDCGYCRRGSQFFKERQDVTRYIFFKPLSPQSRTKASYILSAPNPQAAYEEVLSGQFDSKPLPPVPDNGRLQRQEKVIAPLKVNSTPNYWINGAFVGGADLRRIQLLLTPPSPVAPPASTTPTKK